MTRRGADLFRANVNGERRSIKCAKDAYDPSSHGTARAACSRASLNWSVWVASIKGAGKTWWSSGPL